MTTGMLLFYGGFALLALTIILAVIFILLPPKYTPENEAISAPGDSQTQPLKNAYPTNRLTIRRDTAGTTGPTPPPPGPGISPPAFSGATAPLDTSTAMLPQQAEHTAGGATAMLPQQAEHADGVTAMLPQQAEHAGGATAMPPQQAGQTDGATAMLPEENKPEPPAES